MTDDWNPCGLGPCAGEDGHEGTCAEVSGWADPKRIQQRRTKGWRKPAGVISVARGTDWGNPYRVGDRLVVAPPENELGPWRDARPVTITPAIAVELYREYLAQNFGPGIYDQIRRELGGSDLMCWCPVGAPCHGDLLLEIANSPRKVIPTVLREAQQEATRR